MKSLQYNNMTDIFTKEKRSKVMSNVRSKETGMEISFRNLLRKNGLSGYRKYADLVGKPDIVFGKYRLVIFLDSDFWHGWDYPKLIPKTRRRFWKKKIRRNIQRDREVGKKLSFEGWNVLRFWEHEIKKDPEGCIEKVRRNMECIEKKRNAKIIAIDWFCGAGGMTRGLSDAGIGVLKGIDIDFSAKKTYEDNNPGSIFVEADVKDINRSVVMKGIRKKRGQKILFSACAPCQPFSTLNKNNNKRKDKRKFLLENFLEIVEDIRPDYIIMENVPGLGGNKGKTVYKKFVRKLDELDYFNDQKPLNAKNYGVPQNRRRLVMIASKEGEIGLPKETHGKGKSDYLTVRDAISKYPKIDAGKGDSEYPNHQSPNLQRINLERMKNTKQNGGNRMNWPKNLVLKCHHEGIGYSDVYGRMRWDDPAPTLTCKCTSISNGRFGHPEQNRAISLREAASIQTFPDSYVFHALPSVAAKHIGNAVPVKLAHILGETLKESIK